MDKHHIIRRPSFRLSLLPVIVLIVLLVANVRVFGDASLDGSIQVMLFVSTILVAAIAMLVCHQPWEQLEKAIIDTIGKSMSAILVLFMVGALSGTWMHSGIIPTMIYYGLDVISPHWILLTACLASALVSVCTGSSWTTIATLGVGLLGVGQVLNVPDGWIAGAIISGAYFGDKISPLSETTNLASSVAGVNLFTHIKYMLRTTVPSLIITLIIFTIYGLTRDVSGDASVSGMSETLEANYLISPWLLLVPVVVFFLIYKGLPAVIVLFVGATIGAILIPTLQPQHTADICGHSVSGFVGGFETAMRATFGSVSYETGNSSLDELTSTGGMAGMLKTVWLILSAMAFGGAMEGSGMLKTLTEKMVLLMRGRFSTVGTTTFSCLFLNVAASDQYISIVLPGKMYSAAYHHQGFEPRLLSRTLEDSATVTSVLIPWNSCGMTQASVLGVQTIVYAPFAFFCWISPIMTLLFAMVEGRINAKKMGAINDKLPHTPIK